MDNSLVANSKFQLIFLGVKIDIIVMNIAGKGQIFQSEIEHLGNYRLSFSNHIKQICESANKTLCAIIRLRNYMSVPQTQLLMIGTYSIIPLLLSIGMDVVF